MRGKKGILRCVVIALGFRLRLRSANRAKYDD